MTNFSDVRTMLSAEMVVYSRHVSLITVLLLLQAGVLSAQTFPVEKIAVGKYNVHTTYSIYLISVYSFRLYLLFVCYVTIILCNVVLLGRVSWKVFLHYYWSNVCCILISFQRTMWPALRPINGESIFSFQLIALLPLALRVRDIRKGRTIFWCVFCIGNF